MKIEVYVAEFIWRDFAGGPAFPAFCDEARVTRNTYGAWGPPVLAGPLATAFMMPDLEDAGSGEADRGDPSGLIESGDGSPAGEPGEDPLPAAIHRVCQRKDAESAMQSTKRATRRRERGKKPPDRNNRKLHRVGEKARYKQAENYSLRKNQQRAS